MARIEKFARQFHIDQDWRRNFQYVQYNVKKSLFFTILPIEDCVQNVSDVGV